MPALTRIAPDKVLTADEVDAIEAAKKLVWTYEYAFRQRYNLPPTDPRFLEADIHEMMVDYWANRMWQDPPLSQVDVTSGDFQEELDRMEQEITEGVDF